MLAPQSPSAPASAVSDMSWVDRAPIAPRPSSVRTTASAATWRSRELVPLKISSMRKSTLPAAPAFHRAQGLPADRSPARAVQWRCAQYRATRKASLGRRCRDPSRISDWHRRIPLPRNPRQPIVPLPAGWRANRSPSIAASATWRDRGVCSAALQPLLLESAAPATKAGRAV